MTSSLAGGDVQPPRVLPAAAAPANPAVEVRLTLMRMIIATRKREWIPAAVILLPVMIGALVVAAVSTSPDDRRAAVFMTLAGLGFLAYIVFSARRQLRDGFSVGADHTGVYLRPNLDRKRVVFIPWSGVEGVRVGKWRGPQLVVKPRDTVVEGAFDLEVKGRWEDRMHAEISQHRRIKKLGTNIHAPIPGVDQTELLNNLRYQAAGRAPVEMR